MSSWMSMPAALLREILTSVLWVDATDV